MLFRSSELEKTNEAYALAKISGLKYCEFLNRRFLADEEDFCEENLKRLGIDKRYRNTDMETCLNEITGVMCNGKL